MSNFHPLWSGCYESTSKKQVETKVLKYIKEGSPALSYAGGVPTSLLKSGQQWDFPNAWPNLQHMLIKGLDSLENSEAKLLAFDLAQKWINTNFDVFDRTGHMFEKVTFYKLPYRFFMASNFRNFPWKTIFPS